MRMLATCGKCSNFQDADNDGVGFCTMCRVFVLKDSGCEIMPVDINQTLAKAARKVNMNNPQALIKSNYPKAEVKED